MINAAIIRETNELELLNDFLDAFPGLAEDAIRTSFNANIKPGLLNELRYTPRLAVHPFVWSTNPAANERARNWYFAAVRRGLIPTSGGRYQRSGQMVAGWEVDVTVGDGAIALVARNKSRALRWVTGQQQVPGHATTGWVRHQETLNYWREAAREDADAVITKLINRR